MSGNDNPDAPDHETQLRQLEVELKREQIAAQKLEQRLKAEDHALKAAEVKSSKWKNPVFVAVLAAAVAGAGNAVVALVNNDNLRDVEERKAQSGLILEAVKTGDPDKASVNLQFLLEAGLITDSRAEAIRNYLRNRRPGRGVALPTSSTPFRLEGAEGLPEATRTALSDRLAGFVTALQRVGFRANARQVRIVIDPSISTNSFFDSETRTVKVAQNISADPFAALWAYAQYALVEGAPPSIAEDLGAHGLLNGLSDYFPASFLNDPKVGTGVAAAMSLPQPYLRNLENNLSYSAAQAAPPSINERYNFSLRLGEIWGGAFWAMRARLGREQTDRMLGQAWLRARQGGSDHVVETFLGSLISLAGATGESDAATVTSILRSRGFPVPAS